MQTNGKKLDVDNIPSQKGRIFMTVRSLEKRRKQQKSQTRNSDAKLDVMPSDLSDFNSEILRGLSFEVVPNFMFYVTKLAVAFAACTSFHALAIVLALL